MADVWTIRKLVTWAAKDFGERGIPTPKLDAELIVAHALGLDRLRLYLDLDRPLSPAELDVIRGLVGRRRKREPVAYLLGKREFYGRPFAVSPAVLVPRPETELLVERALARLPEDADTPVTVLDLCCGSGIVGLTLAAERPNLRVVLTDVSEGALAVAKANGEALGMADRCEFVQSDLFAGLEASLRFALIASNPPYVTTAELSGLAPDVVNFEPHLALDGGADGLDLIRRILDQAPAFLAVGAPLLLEIGDEQGPAMRALAEAHAAWGPATVLRDLAGHDRVVEMSRA